MLHHSAGGARVRWEAFHQAGPGDNYVVRAVTICTRVEIRLEMLLCAECVSHWCILSVSHRFVIYCNMLYRHFIFKNPVHHGSQCAVAALKQQHISGTTEPKRPENQDNFFANPGAIGSRVSSWPPVRKGREFIGIAVPPASQRLHVRVCIKTNNMSILLYVDG